MSPACPPGSACGGTVDNALHSGNLLVEAIPLGGQLSQRLL
jgi:hypothetical protein